MPKNKVNNNIKLKSGGGVINDATDGLQVDTTVYPATPTMPAYENLVAGNLLKVVNDNGSCKLAKIVGLSNELTGTFSGGTSNSSLRFIEISTNKFVFAYKDGTTYYMKVATLSGTTLTFGSTVSVGSTGTSDYKQCFDIAKVSDDVFVLVYQSAQNTIVVSAVVGSISGTTINLGSSTQVSTSVLSGECYISVCNIENNKCVVYYCKDHDACCRAFSVSGTTITFDNYIGSAHTNVGAKMIFLDTDKCILMLYSSLSGGYRFTSYVYTVSDLSISAGTQYSCDVGGSSNIVTWFSVAYISSTKLILVYSLSGSYTTLRIRIIDISGSTVTFGNETALASILVNGSTSMGYKELVYDNMYLYLFEQESGKLFQIDSNELSILKTITVGTAGSPIRGTLITTMSTNKLFFQSLAYKFKVGLLDQNNFITSANKSYVAGDNVPITNVFTGFSGLTIGLNYYVDLTGTITTQDTYQKIGTAISDTTIIKS